MIILLVLVNLLLNLINKVDAINNAPYDYYQSVNVNRIVNDNARNKTDLMLPLLPGNTLTLKKFKRSTKINHSWKKNSGKNLF